MIHRAKTGQTAYGEAIGILLLDTHVPFIHGDVGNARSYSYPVRFHRVDGLTAGRIFCHDRGFMDAMIDGARALQREGVRAITGDCGFMAIYQAEVKRAVTVPVFLSSLLLIPFIAATLAEDARVGVVTANAGALTPEVFAGIGVDPSPTRIVGLESAPHFRAAAIDETGVLDSDRISEEVVSAAEGLCQTHPEVRSILLECSLLPPYGEAVARATGLPVYDYLTMVDTVHSALVKKRFDDGL